jgi:hypothetical protein
MGQETSDVGGFVSLGWVCVVLMAGWFGLVCSFWVDGGGFILCVVLVCLLGCGVVCLGLWLCWFVLGCRGWVETGRPSKTVGAVIVQK